MAVTLARFSMSYKVGVLHNHWSGLSSANLSTRINRDNYSVLLVRSGYGTMLFAGALRRLGPMHSFTKLAKTQKRNVTAPKQSSSEFTVLLRNDEKSRKLFRIDFLKRLHSFHLTGSPPKRLYAGPHQLVEIAKWFTSLASGSYKE
jgi:hypothetical protein